MHTGTDALHDFACIFSSISQVAIQLVILVLVCRLIGARDSYCPLPGIAKLRSVGMLSYPSLSGQLPRTAVGWIKVAEARYRCGKGPSGRLRFIVGSSEAASC